VVTSSGSPSVFAGFRFPREVISVAVRWYLRYGLSHDQHQGPGGPPIRTHRPASPGSRLRRWQGSPPLTLLAVALGVMMVGLDGTIVAVANPAIQSHLHASLAGIQWVTNA